MARGRPWLGVVAAVLTVAGAGALAMLGAGMFPFGFSGSSSESSRYDDYRPSGENRMAPDLTGETRTDTNSAPQATNSAEEGAVIVMNQCDQAVRFVLAYWTGSSWDAVGSPPWEVEPKGGMYPYLGGRPLLPANDTIYIRAWTLDGQTNWGGNSRFSIAGQSYDMVEAGIYHIDNRRVINLTCNEPPTQSNAPAAAE